MGGTAAPHDPALGNPAAPRMPRDHTPSQRPVEWQLGQKEKGGLAARPL